MVMCAGVASHALPWQSEFGPGLAAPDEAAGDVAGVVAGEAVGMPEVRGGGLPVCAVPAPGENAKQSKMAATPKYFNTMAPM